MGGDGIDKFRMSAEGEAVEARKVAVQVMEARKVAVQVMEAVALDWPSATGAFDGRRHLRR